MEKNAMSLFLFVALVFPGFTSAGPSFEIREKRDDSAAGVRSMAKLTEDLKFMSGLRRKPSSTTPYPAGKRSDIDMLQTEFVSPGKAAKPTSEAAAALPRPADEASTVRVSGTTVVIPVGQEGLHERSLEILEERATRPPSSSSSTTPAHIEVVIVNPTAAPATNSSVKFVSNATVDVAPEPRVLGQQKKGVKPGDLDLLQTEFVSNVKTPEQTASNPGPTLKATAATTPPVPASESSTVGTTSTPTISPLKHEDVHIVDRNPSSASTSDPSASTTSANLEVFHVNATVVTPPTNPYPFLKHVTNASVNVAKEGGLGLKNKTAHVLNSTTSDYCPRNATNCTLKAKKLVPIVDTVNLNDTASNKTREGVDGGVINFLKRYFTW